MKEWIRLHPLVPGALCAMVGIGASDLHPMPTLLWIALPLLAFAAIRHSLRLGLLATALLFGGLHSRTAEGYRSHPLHEALEEGENLAAMALLEIRHPERRGGRLAQIEAKAQELSVASSDSSADVFHGVSLRIDLPVSRVPATAGLYRAEGRLSAIRSPANPGAPDRQRWAELHGVLAELEVDTLTLEQEFVWAGPGAALSRWARDCREAIMRRLEVGVEDQLDRAKIVQAMALGASEQTAPEVREIFRRSGTLHVFAVSGLHVGLVSLILWSFLRWTGLGRRGLILTVVPLVFCYAFITGWSPSAARASLMVALFLGSILVRRQPALINTLGAAALMLLALDTRQLFHPGFQLSFGVLLSIVLLAAPLFEHFRSWTELDPFLPPSLASRAQLVARWLRRNLAGTFSVSTAAWVGSLPLLLWHFNTVTPSALIANLVLVPLAFLTLTCVCASLLFSLLPFSILQIGANHLACLFAGWMVGSAERIGQLPAGSLHLASPIHSPQPTDWQWQAFALGGGGEAHLLTLGDRHWLMDTGSRDAGSGLVLPALRKQGINWLEGLFLSHADSQHVGGAALVIESLKPRRVFHPMHDPWPQDRSTTALKQLLLRPEVAPPRWRPVGKGDAFPLHPDRPGLRVQILHPKEPRSVADDRGLVLRFDLPGARLLWVADAGFLTERRLLERPEELDCEILIRSAHESDFHGTWPFLEAVSPQVILTADSAAISELALPARLLRYCEEHEVMLFRLPEDGGVHITAEGGTVTLSSHRSGRRATLPATD